MTAADFGNMLRLRGDIGRGGFVFCLAVCLVAGALAAELVRMLAFAEVDARISAFLANPEPTELEIHRALSDTMTVLAGQLAACLPFVYGLFAATAARCRSLRMSGRWAIMLGMPAFNVIFIAVLILVPERPKRRAETQIVSYR